MIDNFALGLTHGLMLLAAWRILSRPDLDDDRADPTGNERRRLWSSLARKPDREDA